MIQATGKNNRIYLTISDKSKVILTPAAARQIISVITVAMIDLIDRANADLAKAQNSYDKEDEDEDEE